MLNSLIFNTEALKSRLQRFRYVLIAALFGLAGLMPILLPGEANAGTLSSRKVTISTSVGDATGVSYAFAFTYPTTAITQGIVFQFCTTAIGTCTKPAGMNVHHSTAATNATQTFSQTPAFTEVAADTGDCTYGTSGTGGNNARYCVSRTGGTSGTAESAAAKAITIDSVVNPTLSGNTTAVYVRVAACNNDAFTNCNPDGTTAQQANIVHKGTVAAAIVRQLTVNGRVAERLDFCVGAVTDAETGAADSTEDAAITGLTDNSVCTGSFPTTTTVDIGVVDDAAVYFAPVNNTATNGALDNYGLAAVKTNGTGGVVITFFAQDGSGTNSLKTFRVAGATCEADQQTPTAATRNDQCFRSAAAAGVDFSALTGADRERFGVKVACIYQGTANATTANLVANTNFDDTSAASAADCENTTDNSNYAWNDTTTAAEIASSAASSTKVVDDELVKLSFAATASATTPSGSYTVLTTYIATPTF